MVPAGAAGPRGEGPFPQPLQRPAPLAGAALEQDDNFDVRF